MYLSSIYVSIYSSIIYLSVRNQPVFDLKVTCTVSTIITKLKPYQNVKLLPTFGEVDLFLECVWVSNMHEGEIL